MAVVLPPVAAAINVSDYNLSKVQDGLVKPVNALLLFARGLQTGQTAEAINVATVVSTAGFKSIITGFYVPNVIANQTSVICQQAGVATLMIWVAPFAGSVVGISTNFSDGSNIFAGSVVLDIYKTGGPVAVAAVTWTSGDHAIATFAKGALPFAAGQYLYLRYTTSAGFTPSGTEGLMASLVVEMAA